MHYKTDLAKQSDELQKARDKKREACPKHVWTYRDVDDYWQDCSSCGASRYYML